MATDATAAAHSGATEEDEGVQLRHRRLVDVVEGRRRRHVHHVGAPALERATGRRRSAASERCISRLKGTPPPLWLAHGVKPLR